MFPLLPVLAVFGLAAGCGDNTPSQSSNAGTSGGGTSGNAGTGGSAAIDGSAGTGGSAAIDGGAGIGGSTGGSGGGTAGRGGTGGSTGGSAGGSAGGGGHVTTDGGFDTPPPIPCYTTAFTAPINGATLTVADDTDHSCLNGFQYTVTITSAAPTGTAVQLFDGTSLLKSSTVSGGTASFAVQLPSSGTTQLSIQYPTTLVCNVEANVTVTCPNSPPTCSISAPTISATHPDLNGVAAPAGDRTSSAGSAYQATFVVNTNAENGQVVSLAVDNAATPSTITLLNATVAAGAATFGVTLVPDGSYEVIATCKNLAGITGTSTKSVFPVDTTPPNLTVDSPISGQFFGPGTLDANGAFSVCAQTSSPDAAGLSSSLGTGAQQNLCVAQGGSAKTCTAMNIINNSTCVKIVCPGAAPFSLAVTLTDAAGNPTVQTVTGVSCASNLPSVQIISPLSDSLTFSDKTKHILAATAPVGVHDLDPNTPGAQVNVVACSDTAGTATLFQGHQGGALTQLGTGIVDAAAVPGDNCPPGLGFVVHFNGVTLPESNESGTGDLLAASEIKVTVTSTANTSAVGTSPAVDVWIDTIPPSLALTMPPGLCGSFTQSATTVTENVVFTADDDLVTVEVQNGASTTTYDTPAFIGGVATFSNVAFTAGQNDVTATESDPAGNATSMTPVPCAVTIGSAPVVTFTTPVPNALLCPSTATDTDCIDDNDPGTPGWQGNLAVHVIANGANVVGSTVTFTDGATTLGSGVTDASGDAQINGVTIPEGVQTITATTDNVPNAGVGVGTVSVTVDTTPPGAPTGLNALIQDRRKTSMLVTWTAPGDGSGNSVAGYEVRYAKVPINAANFDDLTVVTVVPYLGSPASPGQLDGLLVSPLYIENGYYFAVEATDVAGTRSAMLASPAAGACSCAGQCCAARFNVTTLTGNTGLSTEGAGFSLDGSGDANGDGRSDMLIGSFNGSHAYLFLGATGFNPSAPSVVFSSAVTTSGFGRGVAFIGDIDNDGREDLAIAARTTNQVFIYKGRATWPATLTDLNADYVITADATYAGSLFGAAMSRLGDFNGDGVDDFVIGSPDFNSATFAGRVTIVLGAAGFTSFALPNTSRSIIIDGDSTLTFAAFGSRVLGLGHFFGGPTTLVVSAPGFVGAPSGTEGRIYAFHGQTGTAGVINIASADAVVVGAAAGLRIGAVLANLGSIVGALPSVGAGNPNDTSAPTGSGSVYAFSDSVSTGPFASKQTFYFTGGGFTGTVLIGGGIPGRDVSLSLIGSASPDIAVGPRNGTTFGIVDGAKVPSLGTPIDVAAKADVLLTFPSSFTLPVAGSDSVLRDVDGDGYPDFAISNAASTVAGQTLVYW